MTETIGTEGGPPRVAMLGMGWFPDQPGGLNRYFRSVAEELAKHDPPPIAVVLGPVEDAPPWLRVPASRDEPVARRVLRFAATARRVAKATDVVDAHFALYAAVPILLMRRKPVMVHFHGPWASESGIAGGHHLRALRLRRALERFVYRKAEAVVVLSGAFRNLVVSSYGVSPWRVSIIPPGVDLDRFHVGDMAWARQRLGLPLDEFVAVSARRLTPRMGLDLLIEAWAQIGEQARLLIIGEGPERQALEEQIERLGLGGRVELLGRVSDELLTVAYQAADVSVVPTVSLEGFGLITLEALACGAPVIGTDAGALPEVLGPLGHDLVIPAGDASALARRLTSARSGVEPLPSRARCRSTAELYRWSRVADEHVTLLQTIRRQTTRPTTKASRQPRVVYLDHCAQLSGAELALARLLPAMDVEPYVILAEDGPLVELLGRSGIPTEVLQMDERSRGVPREGLVKGTTLLSAMGSAAAYTTMLARRLRRWRPDLVHTNSLKSALYGSIAGRLACTPVVWHARDRLAADYLPAASVPVVRAAARHLPAAVISNSAATQESIGELRRGVISEIIPSPIGIDGPCPRIDDGVFRVGMVGRIASWKGQAVFLRAFATAFPNGEAEAAIVGSAMFGEDGFHGELKQLVVQLGIAERVDFRGFRANVAAELARLDIAVHASTVPEPFGQVVAEAMAAGVAVVASDAGGPTEMIDDGQTGLLFRTGDVNALAAALRRLYREPELRGSLGRRAAIVGGQFTPARIAPLVADVYRRVLHDRSLQLPGRR